MGCGLMLHSYEHTRDAVLRTESVPVAMQAVQSELQKLVIYYSLNYQKTMTESINRRGKSPSFRREGGLRLSADALQCLHAGFE